MKLFQESALRIRQDTNNTSMNPDAVEPEVIEQSDFLGDVEAPLSHSYDLRGPSQTNSEASAFHKDQ